MFKAESDIHQTAVSQSHGLIYLHTWASPSYFTSHSVSVQIFFFFSISLFILFIYTGPDDVFGPAVHHWLGIDVVVHFSLWLPTERSSTCVNCDARRRRIRSRRQTRPPDCRFYGNRAGIKFAFHDFNWNFKVGGKKNCEAAFDNVSVKGQK